MQSKLPDVRITQHEPVPPEIRRTAELNFEFAVDRRNPFLSRVKAFLRGENKLGRKAGAVLDIATIFLPGGVRTGREAAQKIIQRKTKTDENMDKIKEWIGQPSTKAGLVVLTAIAALFGLDLTPELVEEAIGKVIAGGAMVLAGLAALYEMFRREKQ